MRKSRISCSRRTCNAWVAILLLLLLARGRAESSSLSFTGRKINARDNALSTSPIVKDAQNVIQIVETEVYGDGKVWIGPRGSRWSDLKGRVSEPPPSIEPPKGFQFEGDWKIVTSSNRDSLGWEYIWARDQAARRRRLWLRTIVPIPVQPTTSLVKVVREHWNFKGFGMSLYKSLIFARSCGIAIRMPILSNIDWWERHPALPSLSTAVQFYFPPTAVYGFAGSLNVDFVAWLIGRSSRYALYGLCVVLLSICRLLFLPVAILLYPSRQKLVLPIFPLPRVPSTPAIYSLTISQRVGMSISWRISRDRGYEFRTSYWYEYMPTLLHIYELFHRNKQLSGTKMANWLRRKTASMGLQYGGPLPVSPGYFLTAAWSMSGFHFRRPKMRNKRNNGEAVATSAIQSKTLEEPDEEEKEKDLSPRKQKLIG